ncbi:uncharacterized protein KD926_007475 [Aspergillus affinis]|uniref:uncharacterized protein n=1 Tax=Aspergillus affinis TaxID=1070780 RepID=UPI0022FE69C0|nr:uncharacterized protein KD926_007475 [Aspergillus affinis]KAI9041058.1 hypothetical protein KD926_007475 [Aspergillus affinis]
MDENEINLIREIGWHRGKNRFYRACYVLLKELQDVVEQATDDLLLQYHSEPYPDEYEAGYSAVTDIAVKLRQKLESFSRRESEAADAWDALWTTT